MRISSRSIEQIRETSNIVEVASEFTALRRQGARYTGLCPYPDHQEKTPSFSVDPEKGFYYCFGCLQEDERIWTSGGLIPIKESKIGDRVIGLDGRSETITDKVTKSDSTLKIKTGAAKEGIELTPDHWCVFVEREEAVQAISRLHHGLKGSEQVRFSSKLRGEDADARLSLRQASEVCQGDFWLYPMIQDKDRADTSLSGSQIIEPYTKGPKVDRNTELHVNPETAWLYGVWTAEGSIYRGGIRWSFNIREAQSLAARVSSILEEQFGRSSTTVLRPEKNICEVTCSSTDLAALFGYWFGRGCENKRVPTETLSWTHESQVAFLEGYIAGDGYSDSGSIVVTTVSEELAYGVFALCIQSRQACSVASIPSRTDADGVNHRKAYYVRLLQRESVRGFFSRIGGTTYFWSMVTEVESCREEPTTVIDITTSGSHTFLTKTGITHNCQRGGDAIKLVSELQNLSFVESVEYLAERSGIELEYEGGSREDAHATRGRNERRRAGYRALAAAAAYYHKYLRDSPSESAEAARRYIYDRGIDSSTIEDFRLGFAPPRSGSGFLSVVGKVLPETSRKTLDESGLLNSRGGERFAGRITFPISDRRGRIVGFGARSLGDEEPKYLNSPETELFNKRDLLYGFPQVAEGVRKEKSALVVEGYTDVLMLYQHGIVNAVATLGTAMTPNHIRTLSRDADEIHLLFDPDAAGEKAIQRAMDTAIELSVDLRVLRLPEDPADWLRNGRGTPEQFREMVAESTPVIEYSIRRIADRTRGSDAMSRSRAVPEVRSLIQEIKDPVLHREAVRVASEALDVDASSLETRRNDGSAGSASSTRSGDESSPDSQTQAGREVLALILTSPDLATRPLREGVSTKGGGAVALSAEDFADEVQARIFEVFQEHVDGDLGDSLSDERLRPHMDLISSLSVRGEKIYPSEAAFKVAWLRLRILRRERDKRKTGDFDLKDEIRDEIQALEKALRSAEAAAS